MITHLFRHRVSHLPELLGSLDSGRLVYTKIEDSVHGGAAEALSVTQTQILNNESLFPTPRTSSSTARGEFSYMSKRS